MSRSLTPRRVGSAIGAAKPLGFELLEDRRVLSATAASQAVNQFALDVYAHMQREQGNLFFSPLSISTGLAMTSLGAAGQTLSEMQQVLHLGADPAIHDSYRELLSSARFRSAIGENFDFNVSNAIWPQEAVSVDQEFVDAIETDYFGHVQTVDFGDPQEAEDIINGWVADQTEGKIDGLVSDLDPFTVMVLTNTVYFNALWDVQFPVESTYAGEFHLNDGGTVDAMMMASQPIAARTQIDGYDVLELPFETFTYPDYPPGFPITGTEYPTASMVLVMPLDPSTPNVLSEELLIAVDQWLDTSPTRYKLEVELPRFEVSVETQMNELLADLGMPTAFDPSAADFSAMFGAAGPYIQEVFHKATIQVSEQGTEAAAATEVEILLCFAAGTPVLTPGGAKPIEQLQAGDLVLSRDEHNLEADLEPKVIEETRRGNAAVLEITVKGRVIRVTDLHPFFVRGHGWTPAGKLKVGDKLSTNNAEWAEVDRVTETGKATPVFNLRVADHHTYFVGDNEFAVWTHNFYGEGFYVDQPFHFFIRDNVTDVIAFMGRIDDPTQIENSVSPSIGAATIPGDYDLNGVVDDLDYDVWRAAYGQAGAGLPADGNGDGIVNAIDYTIWRDNKGAAVAAAVQTVDPPPTPAMDELTTDYSPGASDLAADLPSQMVRSRSSIPRTASLSARAAAMQAVDDTDETLLLIATAHAVGITEASDDVTSGRPDARTLDDSFESLERESSSRLRPAFRPAVSAVW